CQLVLTARRVDSPEQPTHAQLPQQSAAARNVGMPVGPGGVAPGPYMNMPEAQAAQSQAQAQAQMQAQAQAQAYQQYMQQQQQAHVQRGYPIPHPGHPAQNA